MCLGVLFAVSMLHANITETSPQKTPKSAHFTIYYSTHLLPAVRNIITSSLHHNSYTIWHNTILTGAYGQTEDTQHDILMICMQCYTTGRSSSIDQTSIHTQLIYGKCTRFSWGGARNCVHPFTEKSLRMWWQNCHICESVHLQTFLASIYKLASQIYNNRVILKVIYTNKLICCIMFLLSIHYCRRETERDSQIVVAADDLRHTAPESWCLTFAPRTNPLGASWLRRNKELLFQVAHILIQWNRFIRTSL